MQMKKLKSKEDKKMTMSKDVKPKQWYQLPNGVEYSVDYDFFVANQIRIVRSGTRHTYCSALEAKTFKVLTALNKQGEFNTDEIGLACKEIHREILDGKHGQGTLVD